MTASRVGAARPDARLRLLQSCRRFLEVLAGGTVALLVDAAPNHLRGDVRATTWRWGDEDEASDPCRGIEGATGAAGGDGVARGGRPPLSAAGAAADAFGDARANRAAAAVRSDGREGVPAAAAELAALLFSAYDESTPTLADAGGPERARVRGMTEALTSLQLCFRLVDEGADARGGVEGAAAAAAAPHVAARLLRAFLARAPASAGGAPERRALVAFNAAAARLLGSVADGTARVVASDPSAVVDARAADDAAAATAAYLASALQGTALDAGPCGAPEPTAEGTTSNFSEWRAGRSFGRRSFDTRTTRATRAPLRSPRRRLARRWWTLSDPCGLAPWWRVPPERRAACVGLLATALPAAVRLGHDDEHASRTSNTSGSLPPETTALWVRPFARLLWELKHRDPATTARAIRAIREVASRTPARGRTRGDRARGRRVRTRAVLRARVPPPPSDPTAPRAPARLGPFSRVSPRCQAAAVELLGALPALSPATLRAVAHATLAPGADPRLATRATEAIACNAAAAPLALTVSFLATALAGASSWAAAKEVAPAAARALAQMGDPWLGASLAAPAVDIARRRAERAGTWKARDARRTGRSSPPSSPRRAERVLWMCRKTSRRPSREPSRTRSPDGGAWAGATPGHDADGDADGDEGAMASGVACARLLRAAPRWIKPVFAAHRRRAERTPRRETSTERSRRRARRRRRRNWRRERWEGDERRRGRGRRGVYGGGEEVRRGVTAAAEALARADAPGAARAAKAARLATLAVEAFAEAFYDVE